MRWQKRLKQASMETKGELPRHDCRPQGAFGAGPLIWRLMSWSRRRLSRRAGAAARRACRSA